LGSFSSRSHISTLLGYWSRLVAQFVGFWGRVTHRHAVQLELNKSPNPCARDQDSIPETQLFVFSRKPLLSVVELLEQVVPLSEKNKNVLHSS
jgi:hypothetical protein